MFSKPLTFVDIETTGLNPHKHEILEVAVVKRFPDGTVEEFQSKVCPKRIELAESRALEINHYRPEDWEGSPDFEEIAPILAGLLEGSLPVAHNAAFDKSFLQPALIEYSIPYHWIDTVSVSHLAFPNMRRYSLAHLCSELGISNEGAHTALADARRCMEVYTRAVAILRKDV